MTESPHPSSTAAALKRLQTALSRPRGLACLGVAALGFALAAAALPRLAAEGRALAAIPFIEALHKGEELDRRQALFAERRLETLATLDPQARLAQSQLSAQAAQLQRFAAPERVSETRRALALVDRSIVGAPANPRAWLQKARLHLLLGERSAAAAALREAMILGPREGYLGVAYLTLALQLGAAFDADLQRRTQRFMRGLWDEALRPSDRAPVWQMAALPGGLALAKRAFADAPEALAEIERRRAALLRR